MQSTITNTPPNRYQITKKFIYNLDILVGSDDNQLYCRATQESIDAAIQNFPVVNNNGQKFSIFCSIEQFQKFAPGVYLMFKFLKHLIFMFVGMSIIACIQLLLLLKSPFYQGHSNVVRINLLRLTIASIQPQDYYTYIILDILTLIVALAFLIYWSQNLRQMANQCNYANSLPSYLTVQLKNVQKNFTQQSLKQYLRVVLKLQPHEVYTARNYGQFLNHYSNLTQTAIDLRIKKQLFKNQQEIIQKHKQAKNLLDTFLKLREQYCSIKSGRFNEKKYQPKQVFIVLKSYHDRQKVLSKSNKSFLCLKSDENNNIFQFKACQVQPEAITWQNIGISFVNYAVRAFLVFLVLCIITFIGVFAIFMLQILQTASIGDAYYFREQTLGDNKLEATNNCNSTIEQCTKHLVDYSKLASLIVLTPFIIFLTKKLIMGLLSHSVKFRKYPSEISRIKSQTISLTVFYFVVVGALHLLLYLKTNNEGNYSLSIYELLQPIIIKMFKITNYSPASIHLYSDFSLDWYKQATFFIIIICSTSFNISNGFKFIVNFISFQIQKIKASKQKTLYGVKKNLHGIDLHIQHVNASMIVITYFAFLYGCPIPLTVIFGLINLIILFYITKLTFIRYSQKPLRLGHSISRTVSNMVILGIIIHCLIAPIFLGAQGIGKQNLHFGYSVQTATQEAKEINIQVLTVAQRYQKFGPFYLTIASFTICYVLFRKMFLKEVVSKIKQKFFSKKEESQLHKEMQHFGLFPSYSMHNNPRYGQILRNIYLLNRVQAKRITCPIPASLKILKSQASIQNNIKIFDQIIQINRQYLDRKKQQNIYQKLQELALLKQSNCIQPQSLLLQQKLTDDRIQIGFPGIDQVKQENEDDEQ